MDKQYNNLVTLLKMFVNRPWYLAKFLIENGAMNKHFLKRIMNNKHLENFIDNANFIDNISDMDEYYTKYIKKTNLSKEDQVEYFNRILNDLIKNDEFEDAIKLRDYMLNKKIPRKH